MIFEVRGGFRDSKNQQKSTKFGSVELREAKHEVKTGQGRLRKRKMWQKRAEFKSFSNFWASLSQLGGTRMALKQSLTWIQDGFSSHYLTRLDIRQTDDGGFRGSAMPPTPRRRRSRKFSAFSRKFSDEDGPKKFFQIVDLVAAIVSG